jgi:hypothetical protein
VSAKSWTGSDVILPFFCDESVAFRRTTPKKIIQNIVVVASSDQMETPQNFRYRFQRKISNYCVTICLFHTLLFEATINWSVNKLYIPVNNVLFHSMIYDP